MKPSFDYIDSDEKLIAFSNEIASASWLAVDTEFMRERTYYAQLALIQIASENGFALIDVPALSSLSPLQDAFTRADCLKIMHSASQDIEVLNIELGEMPGPLFDTQIAASFLGEADQISYAAIVAQRLGIALDKGQTRTNWLQRPLSSAQIDYAKADVLYLYALYEQLSQELNTMGRLDWARDESQALVDKTMLGFAPEQAWQRLKTIGRLKPVAQNAAIELATWRERRAQTKDLPREWVMKKQVLTTLAIEQPTSLAQMTTIQGLSDKQIRYYGDKLIKIIGRARAQPQATIILNELSPDQRDQAKKLITNLRKLGEKHNIAPSLIANRAAIEQLVLGHADLPLMQGWRAEIAGNQLAALLQTLS